MHPALSVIVFTTFSGAGYGLLTIAALLFGAGHLPPDRVVGVAILGTATAFITFGLLSSTLHLKHPERAWRALSQWRSSWLSREGVLSILTYFPLAWFAYGWIVLSRVQIDTSIAALLSAALSIATVICTAMIYASLKSIRQWHNRLVLPVYLAFALELGSIWLLAIVLLFELTAIASVSYLALAAILATWCLKAVYWRQIDHLVPGSTRASATGLEGDIRVFDPPHTEENYLLREMGFRVAQKHSAKLRRLAIIFGLVMPLILTIASLALSGITAFITALLAAISATAGAMSERWLFFAEARHTVGLYYD